MASMYAVSCSSTSGSTPNIAVEWSMWFVGLSVIVAPSIWVWGSFSIHLVYEDDDGVLLSKDEIALMAQA